MARKDSIAAFQNVLLERREALRQALAGNDSLLRQISQHSGGDEADFALDTMSVEVGSQLVEVVSRELANVEQALERMSRSRYGKCDACGCSIPLERLSVLPYATCCIKCQRQSETNGHSRGRASDWSQLIEQPADGLRISDFDANIS